MEGPERILGRLEEFQKSAERRFDAIESKVDALNQWRWRLAGGLTLVSVLISLSIKVLFERS